MAFDSTPATASPRNSNGDRSRLGPLTLPQHLKERERHAANTAGWRRNFSIAVLAIEVVVVALLIARRWGML